MNSQNACEECRIIGLECRDAILAMRKRQPVSSGRTPSVEDIPRLTRMFAMFSDEKRLAQFENKWRAMYESSPVGVAGRKWQEHRIATGHLATIPLDGFPVILWGF
jgi:hypothetical protein